MTLTEHQIKIISERPLHDTFDFFRNKLRDLTYSDCSRQEDLANLLGALVASPAAFSLPSPDGSGNVAVKLFTIQQHVQGGTVKSDHFHALIRCIIDGNADKDIWEAVFNIIKTLGALTPPPSSIVPTYQGTPVKTSSSRLADSETRKTVENEIFFEIKDCVYRDVGGFWDQFFDSRTWPKGKQKMLKDIMTAHNGEMWMDFPLNPDKKAVWTWLCALEERFLANASYKLFTTQTANQFKERKGQMDIFFQKPSRKVSTFTYKDILVVGEQKMLDDTGKFKATLLQLTRYVRGVFADQPTRRFVHAFSLCASNMELWVFDRSGLYSSGLFNIHDEPDKFARALVGYATMSDDAMGLDTFIQREKGYRYATLEDANGNETRVRLEELLVRQSAIVCRGTTCYRTRNGHVAKFSWASDKRKPEVEYLKLAEEKGVKGVARVVAHRQITAIAQMRKGLEFLKPHRFRDEDNHSRDLPSAAGITNTASHKRKSSSENTSDNTSGSKRRRSHSQKSKLPDDFNEQLSMGKTKPSLYTSTGEDPFENRIYSCLVVSPGGRVISDFKSIRELLEALRDATRAHQSLYVTGNILHRDISSSNIIIVDTKKPEDFKGMLIDLNLAKVRDSGPSGARHQTGTIQFMAIEVLRKANHTYRHDLESFFYVLLWMSARYSWRNGLGGKEEPPRESVLRKWEMGSFKDIARTKAYHMSVDGLEEVMDEFPPAFDVVKPLCLKIRSILFGEAARLGIGTPQGDPDHLYNAIEIAYKEVIDKLLKR